MTADDDRHPLTEAPGPDAPDAEAPRAPAFDPRMLEALVCPQTHGVLSYDAERQELVSRAAHLAYPIRDGIPVMLASEARPLD
jgi:uncharacterized protein YbaR (Trm112 family)